MWNKPNFISLPNQALHIAIYDSADLTSDFHTSKPVLFMVHGLGLNAKMWKYAVENLSVNYRCIAIDLPGHGASWNQRGNFSMTFYAQIVRGCIEEMKLADITLVGHSMGGQISVIAALQMPAIVNQLVLVSSAGIETFTNDESQKIIQGAEFLYKSPIEINQLLGMHTPHFNKHAERIRELLDDQITQQAERFTEYREMILASVKGMIAEPISNFLVHLTQPVLVIYGEKDQLIPNKWVHPMMSIHQVAQLAKQKIIRSKIEVVSGCGHYLPFEQPNSFTEIVQQFHLSTEK